MKKSIPIQALFVFFVFFLQNTFVYGNYCDSQFKFNEVNLDTTFSINYIISNYYGYGVSAYNENDGFIELLVTGGSPPYTIHWSTCDTLPNIYNLNAGNYGVLVIDNNGNELSTIIEITKPAHHIININEGWNIISTYIQPVNPLISDVFCAVSSSLVLVKDGNGNAYWPLYSVNMIGEITIGEGYMVKTSSICTLAINGDLIQPENTVINIPVTWSILGYLRTDSALIEEMLLTIINEVEIVKNSKGMVYWPSMNLDLIGFMNPGEAYQIKMNSSQLFSYPPNDIYSDSVICPESLTDYDGNMYEVVQIGNQCWMSENINVTHYADGSAMINGNGIGNISYDYSTKYYFDYDDDILQGEVYGKLYSWAAMLNGSMCGSLNLEDSQGVCPNGWHIPDNNDWTILQGELDSLYDSNSTEWGLTGDLGFNIGGCLKDNMLNLWNSPNSGANNSNNFSALPGGYRLSTGTYLYEGIKGYFWSSQANCQFYGWYRSLSYNKTTIHKNFMNKGVALSVRCIRD